MSKLFELKDKTAVITGGASGLGLSIAEGFGQAGASLILLDLDSEKLKIAKQQLINQEFDCKTFQVDITNGDEVRSIVEQINSVDILVNSAGINIRKSATELSLAEYQKVINVNLVGTFLMCKTFGEKMIKSGSGSIINLASIHSHVSTENQSAYASTKGGVLQLTKVLALEYAKHNVRVNALSPGFHHTPLTEYLDRNDETYLNLVENIPMNRFGDSNEIVGPALFLASNASSYVTGTSIVSDGGYIAQ